MSTPAPLPAAPLRAHSTGLSSEHCLPSTGLDKFWKHFTRGRCSSCPPPRPPARSPWAHPFTISISSHQQDLVTPRLSLPVGLGSTPLRGHTSLPTRGTPGTGPPTDRQDRILALHLLESGPRESNCASVSPRVKWGKNSYPVGL